MQLREIQRPIKERYQEKPEAAWLTLRAEGRAGEDAMACSVDIGRALYAAGAHPGVGGAGVAACSGDLLLGALAACAQITGQMVAANMGLGDIGLRVSVEGDLDLRGTLGAPEVPVGFQAIRVEFRLSSPIDPERLQRLQERTERYCVVLQTLVASPSLTSTWR